jgi:ABC-type Na+ efflux pump permease subunit
MTNKTLLIFKHEFLHTIKRVGFIIMTFVVPILALLGIGIDRLTSHITKPSVIEMKTMGYVDETGTFSHYDPGGYARLLRFSTSQDATQALIRNDVSEYFVIPSNYLTTRVIRRYTLKKEIETPFETTAVIKNFLTANLLAGKVAPDIIRLVESPLNLKVTRLTKTGAVAREQSGVENIINGVCTSWNRIPHVV